MAKQLERGERDYRAFTVKANRMLEHFLTANEDWVKKADGQGKDAIWYTIEVPRLERIGLDGNPVFGETVKVYMTPAQKVHLYLESRNYDNLLHMAGGRVFVDRELYSKGKRQEAFTQGERVKLAPETVKQIVSDLTPEEMELAQILEKYYNDFAKGEINRVSNILYGYDKAIFQNYAPIYTDQSFTAKDFGVFDNRAEHVGNLKERIRSKTPTLNLSAFDAFERHVDRTALFVGMAIPTQNWNTLWCWQTDTTSTKEIVKKKWGTQAEEYITNLVNELQGGAEKKRSTVLGKIGKNLKGNYISAVFGFNWGIALKQWGSVPLAGVYLGYRNVPNPKAALTVDRELVAKYTQELDWRSMGYSMPETKFLKENPNWIESNKIMRFLFGSGQITAADTKAASTLWAWAEKKVHKEYPELELGTQEQIDAGQSPFYKKVAEEFENAVARSQSTSDQMHQSEMRKSDELLPEMLTLFGSDSAQTYNALRQAVGEARYGGKKGAGAVGRVVVAAMTNAFWSAGVSFAVAMLKNRGKIYRDDEDELTEESVCQKIGFDALKSLAGIAVGGEELADLIGAIMLKERWFGVDHLEGDVLQEVLSLCYNAGSNILEVVGDVSAVSESGGNLGEYLKRNRGNICGAVKDAAIDIATFCGIPVANVEAYLMGALKLIPGVEAVYDDVFTTPAKSTLDGLTGMNLEIGVGNVLATRGVETSSDTEKALASLYGEGYTDVIPSDTPDKVTVDGEEHKLSAYQQQVLDKAWSGIVGSVLDEVVSSGEFRDADPEKQEKMLKTLFTYATDQAKHELFPELEPSSRADDIEAFEAAGLDMPEFLRCYAEYTAINAEDLKAKEKAVRFSRWVHKQGFTKQQINVITDNLAYFNMTPADAGKFEGAIDSGLDIEDAYDLQEQMAELEPEEGAAQVSDVQRWRLCVDMSSNPAVQIAALRSYMSEKQIRKAEIACHFDVDLSDYVKLYEIRAEYDANGNKSYSQAEYKAAIDSLHLSTEHSGILWQLATGAKIAKNNPYSTEAGEMVLRVLE